MNDATHDTWDESTLSDERRSFQIHMCLGRGGFGEVYKATMVSTGGVTTDVAVKILHQDVDPSSQAVQRLRDEGRLLGALRHPCVLKVYDLPPRLERQLLELFTGVERKGVGCDFRGYYPPGLTAYVPLHELLSEDYQRSTAGALAKRFQPVRSKEALAALDLAEKLAAGE